MAEPIKDVVIKIKYNEKSCKLEFKDSQGHGWAEEICTMVKPADKVKFKLKRDDSGLSSVDKITGLSDILDGPLVPKNDGKVLVGKIKADAKPCVCKYDTYCTRVNGEPIYQDPEMQVEISK